MALIDGVAADGMDLALDQPVVAEVERFELHCDHLGEAHESNVLVLDERLNGDAAVAGGGAARARHDHHERLNGLHDAAQGGDGKLLRDPVDRCAQSLILLHPRRLAQLFPGEPGFVLRLGKVGYSGTTKPGAEGSQIGVEPIDRCHCGAGSRADSDVAQMLGGQVEELSRVVHAVCSERIEKLKADAKARPDKV
jgi:hypothetical protein